MRCIVFTSDGLSQEFVSNKVTTSGTNLLFGFKCEQEEDKVVIRLENDIKVMKINQIVKEVWAVIHVEFLN